MNVQPLVKAIKENINRGFNKNQNQSINAEELVILENIYDQEKLDRMYSFPANYLEAQVHAKASKFGYKNNKLKGEKRQIPVCPCCQNLVATMNIPLAYPTMPGKPQVGSEVFLLPTGASIYFTFIKMVIFYLLIRLVVFDILNYISSLSGKYCFENNNGTDTCIETNFLNISGYNLKSLSNQQALNILDLVSLAFTLLSIAYFTYVRKQMYDLLSWLDFNDNSQQDFSILIQNIPLFICDQTTDKNLASFQFKQQLQDKLEDIIQEWLQYLDRYNYQEQITDKLQKDFWKFIFKKKKNIFRDQFTLEPIITGITLCYDLTEMENLIKYRDGLIARYLEKDEAQLVSQRKHRAKNRKNSLQNSFDQVEVLPRERRLDLIPNQIEVLNQQYMNLCKQFATNKTNAFNFSHFTGKAFISFQYQHYRDYFLRQYEKNNQFLTINQNQIKISRANKPEDIYWFNMKVSDSERAKNIFYSYAILFMLLVLSFTALMCIQFWQKAQNERADNLKIGDINSSDFNDFIRRNIVSTCMALLTNIINTILSNSIELLSNLEQHKTKTQRLNSVIIKTIVSQALNTSLIYYFLFLIFKNNPLGRHGLVNQVLNLVIVSGFISVVFQAFPPTLLFKLIMNRYNYKPNQPINLFQIQLNQALQKPQFDYADMYSFYIVFTFVVSFYGFIAPSATVILIVIFLLQYWIDKINLFRRYASPVDFGHDLIRWILKIFELNILFFAAGYFLWSLNVHFDSPNNYRSICIINISIAFIYAVLTFLVPPKIRRKLLGQQPTDYDHHPYYYYLNQRKFKKTYYKESPATFCLKQSFNNKKGYYLPTAPDPIFIQEEQYQKFLGLQQNQIQIEIYNKAEVAYFENINNPDYDQVAFQEALKGGILNEAVNKSIGNVNYII